MAIEFQCTCGSKHAVADHMVGREFRCGGCGKILTVPGGDERPRRRQPATADDVGSVDERGASMGFGLQITLIVVGVLVLVVLALGCLGGLGVFMFRAQDMPQQQEPAGNVAPVDERNDIVPPPPVKNGVEAK